MEAPTISDQREALRSAITMVRLSAAGDGNGMIQLLASMNGFEIECLVGCLAQLAVTGVAALAGGAGVQFPEMLASLETDLVMSVDDV